MLETVQDKSPDVVLHELPKPQDPSLQMTKAKVCAALPSESVTVNSQPSSQLAPEPANSSVVKLTVDPAGAELGLTVTLGAATEKLTLGAQVLTVETAHMVKE